MGVVRKLGLVVALFSLLACFASADQSVYSDQLDNGWLNWSWADVNFASADAVHGGSSAIAVTVNSAYAGFYVHHTAQDASQFSNLTFWINGGTAASHTLIVQATINTAQQTIVSIPSPTANTWTKVTIPLSQLGVSSSTGFDGFWIQDYSAQSTQPTFYVDDISLTSLPIPTQVNLNIDVTKPLYTIDPRMFGVNTAIWDASYDTPATTSMLNEAGIRALRFPGGSASDGYHWQTNTSDSNTWTWATGFNQFVDASKGAYPNYIITANYGTGTAQEAAAWASYAKTNGVYVHYWEVGNECYGTWEEDSHARPHDPFTYAQQAALYIKAIKAVDPGAQVGVVLESGEDMDSNGYTDHTVTNPRTKVQHNGWAPILLATLNSLKVKPDWVSYHYYAQGPNGESDDGLLKGPSPWPSNVASIRQMLNDYLGANGAGVPICITENNSVYSNPGKQSTSLVNGLYMADSLASAMQTEAKSFVWWDLRNGQETDGNLGASLYGWRLYGDYGIVSAANDRYPAFYAMKLMTFFAHGGDTSITASSDYKGLAVYAVKQANGKLALLVINKMATTALVGKFNINGFSFNPSALGYSYGIPNDNAAKNNSPTGKDLTHFYATIPAANPTYNFPPYSMTVFQLNAL